MSVTVRIVIVDKLNKVACVNRSTYLEFTDAPGLPESVSDDAGNAYTMLSASGRMSTWHTTAIHMPNHITLKYPGATDGFNVPRDMPRIGPTRG